jgi:hypothetical protein
MAEVILAAPLGAGKMELWRRFCQEMCGQRRGQHEASRSQLGITQETVALVTLPAARAVCITIRADDLAGALGGMALSGMPFDRWFRRHMMEICGLSFSCFSPGVEAEILFHWSNIS